MRFTNVIRCPLCPRYQSYDDAVAQGLVSINSNNQVILTADTNNTYNPDGSQGGRPSVRVESTESYNEVLVIGDFEHMPGSTCGVWPACKFCESKSFASLPLELATMI